MWIHSGILLAASAATASFGSFRTTFEPFDGLEHVSESRLATLPGPGRLDLVPDPRGGQRLALSGRVGLGIAGPRGTAFSLSLEVEIEAASGALAIGDDRDPQHGFSRLAEIRGGSLRVPGAAAIPLTPRLRYRLTLSCVTAGPGRVRLQSVRLLGPDRDRLVTTSWIATAFPAAPLPLVSKGDGAILVDNVLLRASLRP